MSFMTGQWITDDSSQL